ncbi:uncharacterized protein GGS22DRAFT_129363 [Annulohypoxylon maeteangense]|uniref:uncharacterized protein n=1 Tax=Annulohypoxylon maeteangense TaxID=1927788 RepID=UPI002008CDA0|nr:uncharacterized protein GGS22DRAFT_129363 [Annulohypoxylon maeteangense]KAI0885450.1 hypothetical protein GGS22DRAFT_129363 [Annulohypoxylon maeteangense]
MMKSLVQTLLFTTATCATIRSRQTDGQCCFQLASVGKVNETVLEDHVGDLLLGGTFQQGGFCLDKTAKTIQDSLKHNCFMRSPDYQFECYQGAVGTTAFEVTKPQADGKYYLTYDNGPGTFYACPIPSGTGNEQTYDIYSSEKANKDGCVPVALALTNETPECATSSVAGDATPTQPQQRETSSQTCSIAASAPSLSPYKLKTGNSSTSAEAKITPINSTIFDYTIPKDFLSKTDSKSSLCALQFRMPVCTSLPKGYPCYSFSGLEQEYLSDSGMAFHLESDDGNASWNSTEVHQVFPGDNTIIGTFECGEKADRKMSWHVSSVREFALEFLQAGVGENAEFQDGIGAWIVPCQ